MTKQAANRILARGVRWGAAMMTGLALAAPAAAQGPAAPPVTVAQPLVETIVDWNEYTGRFRAVNRVELRARVTGYIDRALLKDRRLEGDFVEADTPLFIIDQEPFQIAQARAVAELEAAKAEEARAQADFERAEALVGNDNLSRSTLQQREADLLRAKAQVSIAETELQRAALELEYTQIKAPFDGYISEARVDEGNLVVAGETLLATIVSSDPIHLEFTASEADFLAYSRLNLSGARESSRTAANEVQARLLDEEGWPHKGAMDFVDNEIDTGAGTITGRALFENQNDLFTPGLFARLRLIASGEYEALLIPDAAIVFDQAKRLVMTVDENNVVAPKPVRLGGLHRGLRVVRSGVEPSDLIVINGVQRARPGATVTPMREEIQLSDAPETAPAAQN
ncbi:MAG: efflux RND transporter periplasmic adaptor subunit [Pseudomonadota bacterium]